MSIIHQGYNQRDDEDVRMNPQKEIIKKDEELKIGGGGGGGRIEETIQVEFFQTKFYNLREADNAAEMVIVIRDATMCYKEAHERFGFLHKDISTTNICFERGEFENLKVRGYLLDWDRTF